MYKLDRISLGITTVIITFNYCKHFRSYDTIVVIVLAIYGYKGKSTKIAVNIFYPPFGRKRYKFSN